ncbi:hypothetical protein [Winogradskyella luteola]|uniref:Adenylate kinase n=1 Tax=Winogradskyella luteola TaxID=2828330 RepID=A0A9X1JMU5_9FLAO|nr:hypothetical protein [Winogradskyella luteola]MBV7268661.1 hypothetical protein [Winogradskyella luteola]
MLYLISGASRSGKTTIAKRLSIQKGVPYISLDWLVMGFTKGIPEYGIHDLLMPDDIAERFWSFFKAMCESMIWVGDDCIIEGEAILPELIIELMNKHPEEMKICFLGYTDISIIEKVNEIKKFVTGTTDWLSDKSDTHIENHVKNMIEYSKKIKKSCQKNGLTYFDTSKDFMTVTYNVVDYMMTHS